MTINAAGQLLRAEPQAKADNHKGHEEKQHLQPQRAQGTRRKSKKIRKQTQSVGEGTEENTGGHKVKMKWKGEWKEMKIFAKKRFSRLVKQASLR